MQALASWPLQRFPRKFTSKEISAPSFLKRLIISMALALICSPKANVIPET